MVIKVSIKGLGQIGYVANSHQTVVGDSYSAGRLYDIMGKKSKGEVVMKLDYGVLCKLYA